MATYIGVDFSGSAEQWGPRRNRSNVWVAIIVKEGDESSEVTDLFPVQHCMNLVKAENPFQALARFLRQMDFVAAGIDAPFGIPKAYAPKQYGELVDRIASLPCKDRPFPRGADLLSSLAPMSNSEFLPKRGGKIYRETEVCWTRRKINVRSTLWNGPRGGAPFTVACLRLLAQTQLPIWPWTGYCAGTSQFLVEAFPAAQLLAWELPFSRYNGSDYAARQVRQEILERIEFKQTLSFNRLEHRDMVLSSADALDAVLCAFAAVAVAESRLVYEPLFPAANLEGWIAAHL